MDVAAGGESAQDLQVRGGEAREPEERKALGRVDQRGILAELLDRAGEPLGRTRLRDRARSCRHSSACQRSSSPAAQPRTISGRCSA